MSSSYLWEDHKDDILAFYEEGMSIPVIHKRIRSDVFKISERVLYDKLHEWGLPTDPATRRQRAARAKAMREQKQTSTSEGWSLLSNDVVSSTENGSLGFAYGAMDCSPVPNTLNNSGDLESGFLGSEASFSNINFDFNPTFIVQQSGSCVVPKRPRSNNTSFTSEFDVDDSQSQWSELQQGHARWSADNLQPEPGLFQYSKSPRGLKRQSSTSSNQPTSRPRTTGGSGGKALTASYNHLVGPDPRSSLVSDDSGYAGSSRSSLYTQNPQRSSQIDAFDYEFASLYKVICTVRHESAAIHDLTPPCEHCGFAPIHGLAWHANKLSVEEFKRRIEPFRKSRNLRDKAGNTALHYGARTDFEHLFVLIEFGVDCKQKNTFGQIFLHLIEPSVLDLDLFNLLNIKAVRNLKGCRDHLGQTILHELCQKADTKERRKSILRYFESEGFDALNCFGKTAAESACLQESDFETLTKTATFESNKRRIEQDREVVHHADADPHYKHAETSSNIIHVLSRMKLNENDRLNRLLKYICLGVSVSDYNRDGDLPLISFACQRPNDELKVTTELYIESLLDALKDHSSTEVHMRNRKGETALHCACVDGSHFSVKLLIARGSNVNSTTFRHESILRATLDAQARAVQSNNQVKLDNFKEVIALLARSGAVEYPTSLQERGMQSVVDQMANLSMN